MGRYFSGKTVSPFFGFSYSLNDKTLIKIEHDVTESPGRIEYEIPKKQYSLGFDYNLNSNFSFGIAHERGNYFSVRFNYKNNQKNQLKNMNIKI